MKRLRTLSIARPDELDRHNTRSPWGQAYWRGVNVRKQRERQLRQARQILACMQRAGYVTVSPPLEFVDGEPAIASAVRMVH